MSVPEKLPLTEDETGRRWGFEIYIPSTYDRNETLEEIYKRYNAYAEQQTEIERLRNLKNKKDDIIADLQFGILELEKQIADQQTIIKRIDDFLSMDLPKMSATEWAITIGELKVALTTVKKIK